ncbi:MAG: hypothetical protein M3N91_07630, partial [Pseudomonadota bacterium]|nr:hypothetical protein [Pseudomonadota bacterium]
GGKHFLSAHATYIRENENLGASRYLFKTHPSDHLNTLRADATYSFDNRWTPTFELFEIQGSTDGHFFKTPTGSPDSKGYIAELAYACWGNPNSRVNWANARIAVRWIGYTEFNGTAVRASGNNTLYLNLRFAAAPFGSAVTR